MYLRSLSDDSLLKSTLQLVQKERENTLEVLHHLREVERRSLFATLAYPSLFEYAVKELKYSASAANRRIASMRLLRELPEIEQKVESGVLSLSTLSQAQVFFRQESSSISSKREVLKSLENKSSREVERELVSRCAEPQRLMPEKLRAVSATHTELKLLVEETFLSKLDELRDCLGSKMPFASIKELLDFAVDRALEEVKPKAPKSQTKLKTVETPKIEKNVVMVILGENKDDKQSTFERKKTPTRYVPVQVKREVWERDKEQCSFVNPASKQRCTSKHGLELDHIQPHALGGRQTTNNLRLRCRAHNQLAAVQSFGQVKMASYISRMR